MHVLLCVFLFSIYLPVFLSLSFSLWFSLSLFPFLYLLLFSVESFTCCKTLFLSHSLQFNLICFLSLNLIFLLFFVFKFSIDQFIHSAKSRSFHHPTWAFACSLSMYVIAARKMRSLLTRFRWWLREGKFCFSVKKACKEAYENLLMYRIQLRLKF